MKKVIDKYYWLLFFCLTGVLALLCFYRLGDFNLRARDELRHGMNAFEMMKNDNKKAGFIFAVSISSSLLKNTFL